MNIARRISDCLIVLLILLFCSTSRAQVPDKPPVNSLSGQVLYRNSQGCENLLSLELPGVNSCNQNILVLIESTNLNIKSFVVDVAYVDSTGQRQSRAQKVYRNNNSAQASLVTSAASFSYDVNNVTNLQVIIIADDWESITL